MLGTRPQNKLLLQWQKPHLKRIVQGVLEGTFPDLAAHQDLLPLIHCSGNDLA